MAFTSPLTTITIMIVITAQKLTTIARHATNRTHGVGGDNNSNGSDGYY